MSWQDLRTLLEKFSWIDKAGVKVTGFNPPANAAEVKRKRAFVKYLTLDGRTESGVVECCRVFLDKHQRLLLFPESGQFRRVCDILIMEVDGIRIVSN